MSIWSLTEPEPGILRLAIDAPGEKQNVLNEAAIAELGERLGDIEKLLAGPRRAEIRGLILVSGKAGTFIAGADVKALAAIPDRATAFRLSRAGQELFQRLASLPIRKVAAVSGPCLGGGYEISLACDRIVAGEGPKTLIGLPETKLGIIPGWGGCVRLPRRIGMVKALEYILAGRASDARRAARDGLVDAVCPPALLEKTALRLAREGFPPRSGGEGLLDRLTHIGPVRSAVISRIENETLAKSKGHYPQLEAAIRTVAATLDLPIPEALEVEAEAFADLIAGPEAIAKELCHVFFLTEKSKSEMRERARAAKTPIRQVGVVGAGVMGGGIAWALARAGILVRLRDIRPEALTGALAEIEKILAGEVKRKKITRAEAASVRGRVFVGTGWEGFGTVDLVIEAVVESLEIKKKVFEELGREAKPGAVLATNTSALPVGEMARASGRPGLVAGFHFFNPVHRMPLVEIIRAEATTDKTIATLFALAQALGKTPVLVNDAPGFLVNRILLPYLLEAVAMVSEGVGILEIDRAALAFGMPMGPLRLADEVGLDVCLHVGRFLAQSFPDRVRLPTLLEEMTGRKELGKKSGKGFYIHRGEEAVPIADGGAVSLEREAIERRLFRPMVREAERILFEKIVASPEDVDLGMIMGTGFPPFRGGLLHWGRNA